MYIPVHHGRKILLTVTALIAGMFIVNRFLPHRDEAPPVPLSAPDPPPVREVLRQKLTWVTDHFNYENQPFTGLALDYWPNQKLKQRWPMVDGKWHGLVEEWNADGQQRVATNFDHGQRHGENTYWNPDGSVQKKQLFDHNTLISEETPPHP
jgi:hypothetical protein